MQGIGLFVFVATDDLPDVLACEAAIRNGGLEGCFDERLEMGDWVIVAGRHGEFVHVAFEELRALDAGAPEGAYVCCADGGAVFEDLYELGKVRVCFL